MLECGRDEDPTAAVDWHPICKVEHMRNQYLGNVEVPKAPLSWRDLRRAASSPLNQRMCREECGVVRHDSVTHCPAAAAWSRSSSTNEGAAKKRQTLMQNGQERYVVNECEKKTVKHFKSVRVNTLFMPWHSSDRGFSEAFMARRQ